MMGIKTCKLIKVTLHDLKELSESSEKAPRRQERLKRKMRMAKETRQVKMMVSMMLRKRMKTTLRHSRVVSAQKQARGTNEALKVQLGSKAVIKAETPTKGRVSLHAALKMMKSLMQMMTKVTTRTRSS